MITGRVAVTKDRLPTILAEMKKLSREEVLVGVPAAEDPRSDGPIGNAAIGYLMETGSPSQNIPARPHLVPGIDEARPAIVAQLAKGVRGALEGASDAASKALTGAGLVGQNAVRAKITNGPFVPLSPRTLAARRAAGRKGEKPLMDSGRYRQAITFAVRRRGAT